MWLPSYGEAFKEYSAERKTASWVLMTLLIVEDILSTLLNGLWNPSNECIRTWNPRSYLFLLPVFWVDSLLVAVFITEPSGRCTE